MGDSMQQLSGQDASFLYFETPNSPMHIGGIMIYDPSTVKGGKQGFKDILRAILDSSGPHPFPLVPPLFYEGTQDVFDQSKRHLNSLSKANPLFY